MSTRRVTTAQFKREAKGSTESHQRLVRAALDWFRVRRIPAVPIHTGPRVMPIPGGAGFRLLGNPQQRGVSDVLACLPPHGRLALVEAKTGRARRTPEQVALQADFARAGALCIEMREVADLEREMANYRFNDGRAVSAHLQGGKA